MALGLPADPTGSILPSLRLPPFAGFAMALPRAVARPSHHLLGRISWSRKRVSLAQSSSGNHEWARKVARAGAFPIISLDAPSWWHRESLTRQARKTRLPLRRRGAVPQLGLTDQLPSVSHEPSRGPCHMLDRTHGESVVRKWSRRVEASLRAAKLGRDGFLIRCTFRVSRLIRWTRVAEIRSTRVAAYQ
jgi:hypothetical protein